MKNETREMLKAIPTFTDEFFEILDVPDEQFDAVYPELKTMLESNFSGEKFQNDLIESLKNFTQKDIDEAIEIFNNYCDKINEDETLSDNKKSFLLTMFNAIKDGYTNLGPTLRVHVPVKIFKLNPKAEIPQYAHPTDAGADIKAVRGVTIGPNETKIVKTGLAFAIPAGYEIQVRPRSGLSVKTGLRIANAPGTIKAA